MLATAEDTNRAYSCIKELIPCGPSAAPHIHEAADESFYIIEGEMTFFIEDLPIRATAGSFVSVPRGTKHDFQIDSETVRLTNVSFPGGKAIARQTLRYRQRDKGKAKKEQNR